LIVSNKSDKPTEFLNKCKSVITRLNTNTLPTIDKEKLPVEQGNSTHNGRTQPVDVPHLTLQQFITMEGRLPMRSATSGQLCSACHTGKANNPQQASCGHICCTQCWVDRFKVRKWSFHYHMVLF